MAALQKAEKIWMNGHFVAWDDAKIHVLTHSFHYGTGVFEGIRCYDSAKGPAIFRLDEHVRRLYRSAKIIALEIPYPYEEIFKACVDLVKGNRIRSCYLRPVAYLGYGAMGVGAIGNPVDVLIASWPWGAYLGEKGLKEGIRATVSNWRKAPNDCIPSLAKACGPYLNAVLAVNKAHREGYDECILLNHTGNVCEGSGENIFYVRDGTVYTNDASSSILMGITRASVLQLCADLGLTVVVKNIAVGELFTADEVFMTGTAAEVTPVREIDLRPIGNGKPGPITLKLQGAFFDVVLGKTDRYAEWLTHVKWKEKALDTPAASRYQ